MSNSKKFTYWIGYFQLEPLQKAPNFDAAFFFENRETSLRTSFWTFYKPEQDILHCFKGFTHDFSLATLKKDREVLAFWIIIKSRNLNMNPEKVSHWDDDDKNFEFYQFSDSVKKSSLKM